MSIFSIPCSYTYAFHISIHIHITFITYNLYIPIACQSFPFHALCLWHNFYLYFSCISVSIFYIFHIHSIIDCSMSLTYLLSILSYLKYFHITYLLYYSYTLCFRLLSVLFLYWFKANTFISHLYFKYYMNF